MTGLYVSLAILATLLLVIIIISMTKTWKWESKFLKGLALPEGSISGLIAILVIGAFVIFIFFGKPTVTTTTTTTEDTNGKLTTTQTEDSTLFTTVLTAFGTLTGAIAGFYFGGRTAQSSNDENRQQLNQLAEILRNRSSTNT